MPRHTGLTGMNALYKYKRTMPSAPAMNQTDTGIGFGSASLSRLFICLFMLRYEGGRSPRLPGAICTLCTLYSGESDTPYAAAFIVIEDSWGYQFGGFLGQPIHNKRGYYGSGESFVFAIRPQPRVYRWTRRNDLFVITNRSRLAMGGGQGTTGGFCFQLDDELNTGIANPSETFGKPVLASNEFFRCLDIEVWTLEQTTFSV